MDWNIVDKIIKNALEEDIYTEDITSNLLIPPSLKAKAKIIAKEDLILCGIDIVRRVFKIVDPQIDFYPNFSDGEKVPSFSEIATIFGLARSILKAERVVLNFLQHLSGIATLTRKFVEKVKDFQVIITDTRKTHPGLRFLEKYAVLCGGGKNHRMGLFDGILIKDNHISLCGSIRKALEKIVKNKPHYMKVEIEVRSLDELREVLEIGGVDIVMLDNMKTEDIILASEIAKGKVILEVSGGVNLENIREIAKAKVDVISIGALTHSARFVDISLYIEKV